jgi:hypothetical protein
MDRRAGGSFRSEGLVLSEEKKGADVACLLMGGHLCLQCEVGYVGYISAEQSARFLDQTDREKWLSRTISEDLCVDCILEYMTDRANANMARDMAQWKTNQPQQEAPEAVGRSRRRPGRWEIAAALFILAWWYLHFVHPLLFGG